MAMTTRQKLAALHAERSDAGAARLRRDWPDWVFGTDAAGWYAEYELHGARPVGGGHLRIVLTGKSPEAIAECVAVASATMDQAGLVPDNSGANAVCLPEIAGQGGGKQSLPPNGLGEET